MRSTLISLAMLVVCSTAAIAEKKVALVIGNTAYPNRALSNPERDAQLLGTALRGIGFELVGGRPQINLDKTATDNMVRAFGTMAQDADIALFYFSGHGVQVDGRNHLLPLDFRDLSSASLLLGTLNADSVLTILDKSRARVKVMLLDACRTPFLKGQGNGFAWMESANTVIGFATQPNTYAWEGPEGGNSPYAKALGTFLRVPGLQIHALLNEVGLAVMANTNKAQRPWVSTSPISGEVYLNPPAKAPLVGSTRDTPPVSTKVTLGTSLPYIQLAYTQLDNKDYALARDTLTQGIAVDQDFAQAYSYRGFAWYLEGLSQDNRTARAAYDNAFRDLNKAIELDPNYAPVRRHRGSTLIASYRARKALGESTNNIIDRAIVDLNAALNLDPRSKTTANALGDAYLIQGSYNLAIESFRIAINRDRTYAAPYSGLCKAYRMIGNLAEARRNAQLAADRADEFRSKRCLASEI